MNDVSESALLKALLDAAADAIIVSDASGRIIRANDAAARLFRHSRDAMLGQGVAMLMPRDLAQLHPGFIEHHKRTGERRIIGIGRDVVGLRGDKTTFPLHLSIGRADIDDEITFVAILHDQTQRKTAEEALTRAQRMDAVGQMTNGIAHDFNNLLTIIIGNLELLEMQGADDRAAPLIADALHAAELGADLTSRLLLFARKGELKRERLSLVTAVHDAAKMLQRTLTARVELEVRTPEGLWDVMTDPAQLDTAMVNLALNAQDAMPAGGRLRFDVDNVTIDDTYVAELSDISPGRYVRLSISDTGTGMDAATQARVLEPFFTTKAPGKGTGLGLSMVYGFIRQSGGNISIYSEVDRGTSVSLYLPAATASEGSQADVPASIQDQAFEQVGHGQCVLVVEDDPAVRRLSETRIAAMGFKTLSASDADEAMNILSERQDVAIVFTDLIMPGSMTGRDLAERLRQERPGLPVILTSGFSDGMATLSEDGLLLLRKPVRQADLVDVFRKVLNGD